MQHKEHVIDSKRVEAKAAVRSADGNNNLTRKMFVGGTVGGLNPPADKLWRAQTLSDNLTA